MEAQMGTPPEDASPLPDLEGAANVLLLNPTMGGDEACFRLLQVAPPERERVLHVTFTRSAERIVEDWNARTSESPVERVIVDVNVGQVRGGADVDGEDYTVREISSASDLTGVGIAITEHLSEWAEEEEQIVVCFRSLTTLLQYVDFDPTFRFLHTIAGRVDAIDAVAHYHMDPDAHDDQTVTTMTQLVDAVVEPDGEGGFAITRRWASGDDPDA